MNLDKTNQWIMIAANVGVLAGIIFLAVELQQNTKIPRYHHVCHFYQIQQSD